MANRDALNLEIVTYEDRFAAAFKALNLLWLEGYGLLEAGDLKYLDQPREAILVPGGQIFLGLRDGEPVGTCAIVPHTPTEWELLKLAVHPSEQGRGLGRRLALAALDYAAARAARRAVLVSNSRLVAAIRLYESLGFRHAPLPPDPGYATADVHMVLDLPRPRVET